MDENLGAGRLLVGDYPHASEMPLVVVLVLLLLERDCSWCYVN